MVSDAVTFFQAFEGMEEGFRERAHRVRGLLADPGTAFVLVASPRRDAVREVEFFAEKLRQAGIAVEALVVNRMHPRFGTGLAEADRERARTLAGTPLGPLYENLADFSPDGRRRGGPRRRAGRRRSGPRRRRGCRSWRPTSTTSTGLARGGRTYSSAGSP